MITAAKPNPEISAFLQQRIDAGDFPSAVFLVASGGEIKFVDALGNAVVEPEKIPSTINTIYDLASLTKVLVTGLLTAIAVKKGLIENLDISLREFYPRIDKEKAAIKLIDLLTHSSGLTSWLPFYLLNDEPGNKNDNVIKTILDWPLEYATRSSVVYSDPNFILLADILCKIFSRPSIDVIADEEIFTPLGLKRTFYNPPTKLKREIAASEKGNEFEKNTCREKFPDLNIAETKFRNEVVWGEVHDGNCWFMGGVSGHAGLFADAADVFEIAKQFLPSKTALLDAETCYLFTTNFTQGLDEDRSAAFQLASTKDSTAGKLLSPNSFGHLGFTGTSLWIDPQTETTFILLTNRTHDRELPFVNINSVRRDFHDLAHASLKNLATKNRPV